MVTKSNEPEQPELTQDTPTPEPEPAPVAYTVATLLNLISNREELDRQIAEVMTALKIDEKGVKKIRKAAEAAEKAKRTYDALVAGGMVPS